MPNIKTLQMLGVAVRYFICFLGKYAEPESNSTTQHEPMAITIAQATKQITDPNVSELVVMPNLDRHHTAIGSTPMARVNKVVGHHG
jgi:hypothetical protein